MATVPPGETESSLPSHVLWLNSGCLTRGAHAGSLGSWQGPDRDQDALRPQGELGVLPSGSRLICFWGTHAQDCLRLGSGWAGEAGENVRT